MNSVIDLLPKDEYHSQINNRYYPKVACMCTSYVMGLKAEGIEVIEATKLCASNPLKKPFLVYPTGMQPEDYLMVLLRSEWGKHLLDEIAPWFSELNPNEVHTVLAEAVNRIIGTEVCKFINNGTIVDIEEEILQRHPVVLSGNFFKGQGHAVVITGAKWNTFKFLNEFIMNDPYGMYPIYNSPKGNDLRIKPEELDRLWGGGYHIFRKEGFA